MSRRHHPRGGYGHGLKRLYETSEYWEIWWVWDRYYHGDRKRYPQRIVRLTDYAGAVRFAKKWELPWKESWTEPES